MAAKVFISYAREDRIFAEKLYADLKQAGVEPWLDCKSLMAGQDWDTAIRNAISNSSYFIALLSSRSVKKNGYLQTETRYALDTAKTYSQRKIFIIPVRIDECQPSFEELGRLHYADLFPSYKEGFEKLLIACSYESSQEKPELYQFEFERRLGRIVKLTGSNFGFISSSMVEKQIFFHAKELTNVRFDDLTENDYLTFLLAGTLKPKRSYLAMEIARI